MRYSAERKQQTYERILIEAAGAIRLIGPDKISIPGLMAKVGLTHGGFYAHFKSKDDLIAESITQMFEDHFEVFQQCTQDCGPTQGLSDFIDVYLGEEHYSQPEKGCPLVTLGAEVSRLSLDARARFQAGLSKSVDEISKVLILLGKADANILATSMLSEMAGAMIIARAMPEDAAKTFLDAAKLGVKHRLGLSEVDASL